MVNRWTITDDEGSMTFQINPYEMSSPHGTKNVSVQGIGGKGSYQTVMSPKVAQQWTFTGNVYNDEEYEKLVIWHEKDIVLYLTDHLLRSWNVVSESLDITDRRNTAKNDQRYTYTWTVLNMGPTVEESS